MTFTRRIIRTLFLCTTLALCASANFAQNPDGDPIGRGNEIHDQRVGSMLIYNYYTSNTASAQNTLISITNTHESSLIFVKLYFVNGDTGQITPSTITIATRQTRTLSASGIDPNTTGYMLALAVNELGEPVQFDFLFGSATIKLASGHQATLGAVAVPINANYYYAALPRQLALDQVPSPLDNEMRLLVINRIDGDLINGMPALGALQAHLYNDLGNTFRFISGNQGPQAKIFTHNLFTIRLNWQNFWGIGRYGWLRVRPVDAGAVTGAALYFTRNPKTGTPSPAAGSYNLRHLTSTQATLQTASGPLYFGY